ncbi:MAG TPA: alkaline phosphatase family protein, partial [Acetobacteraceae bacterium]
MTDPFLLVVFDGLRPDMVQPHTTPNLLRLARMGMRFAHARSVFPSETRVCSASVATGCMPRRHGLVANRFAHPLDLARSVDTGQMATLVSLEQETGSPVLEVPTLGEVL